MCGIAQVAFLNTDKKPQRAVADKVMQILMGELLIATLSRGKDATGVALAHEDKSYAFLKGGWESPKMVNVVRDKIAYPGNWEALLDLWSNFRSPVVNAIGHVRKETKGYSWNNDNCHPIHRSNIVGVHNGQVENDVEILNMLEGTVEKRKGECDSEAIFALMEAMGNDQDWTPDMVKELCAQLSGAFAVLAFNRLFPHKHILFRNNDRPASIAIDFDLGLFITGSDTKNIDDAITSYNRIAGIYHRGTLPQINANSVSFGANKGFILDTRMGLGDAKYPYEFIRQFEFDVSFMDKKKFTSFAGSEHSRTVTQNAYQHNAHQHSAPKQLTSAPTIAKAAESCVTPCTSIETDVETEAVDDAEQYIYLEPGVYVRTINHEKDKGIEDTFAQSEVANEPVDAELEEKSSLDDEDWEERCDAIAQDAFDAEEDTEVASIIDEHIDDAFINAGIENRTAVAVLNEEAIRELCNEVVVDAYKLGFTRCMSKVQELSEELDKERASTHEWASKLAKKEEIVRKAYAIGRAKSSQLQAVKKMFIQFTELFSRVTARSPYDQLSFMAERAQVQPAVVLEAFREELEESAKGSSKKTQTFSN